MKTASSIILIVLVVVLVVGLWPVVPAFSAAAGITLLLAGLAWLDERRTSK